MRYWRQYSLPIVLIIFLLLMATTFILVVHLQEEGSLENERSHTQQELQLLASIVQQTLQRGDYQEIQPIFRQWGSSKSEVMELRLEAKNGVMLGEYKRSNDTNNYITLDKNINYSYHGEANLYLKNDTSDVIRTHNALVMQLSIMFTITTILVVFLIQAWWSRRRETMMLETSEARFRTIFENTNTGIASTDNKGNVTSFNETFRVMLGYDAENLKKMNFADFTHPEDLELENEYFNEILTGQRDRYYITKRYIDSHGNIIWVNLSSAALRDSDGKVINFVAVVQDVSEQKNTQAEKNKLETQLQQARKMESVGRLAGGVAHDFNNMLGVILGYTDMALEEINPSQLIHIYLIEVRKAAKRSADLTRQLLAFARQQTIAPKILDINSVISGMLTMLHRLLGEDISIIWKPAENLWPVMMDPSQFDQVVTNLCINARDAIGQTGSITITTSNCYIDETFCKTHVDAIAGEYVRITVSDTGSGMNEETLAKIFEPFFTTKDVGKGSGLGLATVYGAVIQNAGFITVTSQPGSGSSFETYLPRHLGKTFQANIEQPMNTTPDNNRGHETILLVEDEPTVLKITTRMLESKGYTVVQADNPAEAIQLIQQHMGKIDLLLSDVIMPGINGGELATTLQLHSPDLKCLFMSGYTADVIAERGMIHDGVNFIHKPFSADELADALRQVLDKNKIA